MRLIIAACAVWLALGATAYAQGKGNGNGKGQGNSKSNGAPSQNDLAPVAVAAPVVVGATPIAWIDDATLLDAGTAAVSFSAVRWDGAGVSEVDAPVVNAAFGLAPRVQISASVPRTLGSSDPSGIDSGVGTSFFSAKTQVYADARRGVKVAVAPTLQVLGAGVAATLGPDESRTRFGLPVSAEVDRGSMRVYGGGGYFSPGIWFTGAAVAFQTSPALTINGGVSRAWRSDDGLGTALGDRDRKEIAGGAVYALSSCVAAYGSIGRTFATLDENGAGTTIGGGVSICFRGR